MNLNVEIYEILAALFHQEKFMNDVRNLVMLVNSPSRYLHQSFFAYISNQTLFLLLQPIEILPS